MSEPTCHTFRFWSEASCTDDYGDCRRYPPTILATSMMEITVIEDEDGGGTDMPKALDVLESTYFPLTSSTDWCGEHQPKVTS